MSNRSGFLPNLPRDVACQKPRILLADDHVLFNEALTKILQPEFDVVGTASNGRFLLQLAPKLRPDVILLDLSMPLMNGSEAGLRLKTILPEAKIIVLTASEDPLFASKALRSWASGYLLKKAATEELVQAIRQVLQGAKYLTPCLRRAPQDASIRNDDARDSEKQLTPRQREVLQLFAEGYSMKEVANILSVATRTVAFHKYKIMGDLRVKTNADLLRLAIKENLMRT
jgi:DNA-binding NarL/FixJ family response regulator